MADQEALWSRVGGDVGSRGERRAVDGRCAATPGGELRSLWRGRQRLDGGGEWQPRRLGEE
jgi:hypothetical protein